MNNWGASTRKALPCLYWAFKYLILNETDYFSFSDNSVMYPYLIACSIVGLIFGSLLIWLLHLQFPLIFNRQPPDGYISFYIKYLKGIFSKLFKNTWETFYRVLTIQRSELFPKKEVPRYNIWFW